KLDVLLSRAATELSDAFADVERDAAFVTIMLFGRTRAGKSTTMEALTAGDGASIGVGRQHTTTEIRTYYYPRQPDGGKPNTPALRIVDTPGIDGFEGDALAEMAERFIERSDHILFLLTDDKATADELERFGAIRTQSKGVTVLLNVKASDEDLDLLVDNPVLVFKQDEIDGHTRRICGYLEKRFGMLPPRVIPIHARAAWLAKSQMELPEGVGDRSLLRKHSRLSDLEGRIEDFVRQDARLARLRTPRDLLLSYLISLKDELRPLAGEFRQVMGNMDQISRRLRDGTERARGRVARRFPLLRARFQTASDAIPGMIDEVIAAGGRGAELDAEWKDLLRRNGVTEAPQWFVAAAQQDFKEEVEAEVQAANFDFQFSKADGMDERLGRYYESQDGEKKNKYARAGIRVVGGTGASLLAGWAVTNFWNPTGWAALAAVVVVGVVGFAGEELARKATEEWERSSKRDMYEKREEIALKLRERLWADYRAVRTRCDEWLDKAKDMQTQMVEEIARPVSDSSRQLWQATVHTLDGLDEIADRVNEGLVRDLFAAVVHECESGAVSVTAVTREIGHRTKVAVSSAINSVNAVAACVGSQGSRIRRIAEALGNGKLDLVDAGEDLETQVIQALGLRAREPATVSISIREGQTTARVRVASPTVLRAAVGPRGVNVRLASKLIGVNIVVVEK
ncbi:GTPase, partial [Azospirillum sp. B4]|uniref:GTPase n=1 Tax=Azospirillum sp. B4 TaxID=95605 RepID=UPI0019002B5D